MKLEFYSLHADMVGMTADAIIATANRLEKKEFLAKKQMKLPHPDNIAAALVAVLLDINERVKQPDFGPILYILETATNYFDNKEGPKRGN
jgi:hypothetical protein